jgi:hypothetical protein
MALSRVSEGAAELSERIVDSERIQRICRALVRFGATGRVIEDGAVSAVVSPVSKPSLARKSMSWSSTHTWTGSKTIEIAGPLSLYRFCAEAIGDRDGCVEVRTPSAIEVVRTRRHARVGPTEPVLVEYLALGGAPEIRELRNASWDGLSFAAGPGDAVTACQIVTVVIDWGGRLRIQGQLEVKHVSHVSAAVRVIGGTIAFASDDDAYHWRAEVDALVSPMIRRGGVWTRDVWELFETSGYFSLSNKEPNSFVRFRRSFTGASRSLARSPALGSQMVWPSGRGVEASASVVALNDRAAFIYHLAGRTGPSAPGQGRLEIIHALYAEATRWIMAQEAMHWLVVWVQDAARFTKRTHLDFTMRHADGVAASIVKLRALEIPARRPAESAVRLLAAHSSTDQGWTLRAPNNSEFDKIAAKASCLYPPSFVAAHALVEPSADCMSNWAESGLQRGRELVVAERRGSVEAAAVIEWAEEGVHLFGLLDVLRVIPIGQAAGEASAMLLDYARDRFGTLDKPFFIFAADASASACAPPDDAKDLGLTHCTVLSAALLPSFLDHLWEVISGAPH